MAYCTREEVDLYISVEQIPDISAAIASAESQVNKYCRDYFEPTQLSVYTETNRAHFAELPYSTISIASILALPSNIVMPVETYSFENFSRPIIRFNNHTPYNLLVVGLEPYNNDLPGIIRLQVDGTFGYETTPFQVRNATALLTAWYLSLSGLGELKGKAQEIIGAQGNINSVQVEGYSVSYFQESATNISISTGSTGVDKFLAPYRRKSTIKAG